MSTSEEEEKTVGDIYTSHRNRAGEMHPQVQGLAPGSGVRPPRTHSCWLSQLKQQSQIPSPLTLASESRLAGSAGTTTSTVRVSTAITPTGIPPSLRGRAQVSQAGSARHHPPVDSGVRWVHPAPADILQACWVHGHSWWGGGHAEDSTVFTLVGHFLGRQRNRSKH